VLIETLLILFKCFSMHEIYEAIKYFRLILISFLLYFLRN